MPVWQFRAVTCSVGGLALLAMAKLSGGNLRLARGDWLPLLLASIFNMTIWHVTSGYGLTMIGAGHAAVVCYTLPVWTALLSAFFLRERLTPRVFAASCSAWAGWPCWPRTISPRLAPIRSASPSC
jgi:drug/metabolite transporter (DMT)-like permease